MSATPRPWLPLVASEEGEAGFYHQREDGGRDPLGFIYMPAFPEESEYGRERIALRDFLIRAVNSYDELVAALEAYITDYDNPFQVCHNGFTVERARAALARAKGNPA